MADDKEPEEDFDFGSKKKSKKKKEKKETAEEMEEGDRGGDGRDVPGEMVETTFTRGPLYSYDELLTRLYQIIEDKNPTLGSTKKYVMKPPQIVRVGSKKVGWVNFSEICQMMNRPPEHVVTYVLAEFGTEGSMAGDGQLILKGRYLPKHAESLLRKYIKEFITCEMCKSATTTLVRDSSTRLYMVNCGNCGASRTATSIKSGYHAVTRAERKKAKFAAG